MGLRLIYGKSGTGKSEFIFKEICNAINKEEKIYIITPEQFSFTAEVKLLSNIETESVINAEVLTFDRMAYRVKSEVGGVTKVNLAKTIYLFTPQGQATKIANMDIESLYQMPIYSVSLMIIINIIGLYLFSRKELK